MKQAAVLATLAALVCARLAVAEVSLTIPAPPKPPPTPTQAQRTGDLGQDRAAWLATLAAVRNAKVSVWREGADVNCIVDTRNRLVRDGYRRYSMIQVMDLLHDQQRTLSGALEDLLGGGLTQKVALEVSPGMAIALVPRPGPVPVKAFRANFQKLLSGLTSGTLARVTVFVHRELRLPVGGVCAEVDLSGASFAELTAMMDLIARATAANLARPGGPPAPEHVVAPR